MEACSGVELLPTFGFISSNLTGVWSCPEDRVIRPNARAKAQMTNAKGVKCAARRVARGGLDIIDLPFPVCSSGATNRSKGICRFSVVSVRYLFRACGVMLWSLLRVRWDTCACQLPDRFGVPRVLRRSCPIFDLCAGILSSRLPLERQSPDWRLANRQSGDWRSRERRRS